MNEILPVIRKWIIRLLASIAAVLLSVMTLLVLYQVFTCYVLNNPVAFTEELARYFLIWTGFIGVVYAFITREHMCLVLVHDSLSPAGRRLLTIVIDVLTLFFAIFVITLGGLKLTLDAQKVFPTLLGTLRSLAHAVAPISGLFITLTQIISIYEDVTGITIEGGNEQRVSDL